MNNIDKKQVTQCIINCLWSSNASEEKRENEPSDILFMRDGYLVSFEQKEAENYFDALNQVTKYELLTTKYTKKVISDSFRSFLVRLIKTYEICPSFDDIKKELDNWLQDMVNALDQKFTYFALIENMVAKEEITIGGVKIEPLNDKTLDQIKNSVFLTVDKNPNYSDEDRNRMRDKLSKNVLTTLENSKFSSLASISFTTKDVDKGLELAIYRIREMVDLLRFFGVFNKRTHPRESIALKGEFTGLDKWYLAISDPEGFFKSYHLDFTYSYSLDTSLIKDFNKRGFQNFSNILEKDPDDRSELENKLLLSIKWVSEAIRETSDFTRFLKICIGLESLLCSKGDMPYGSTMGERLAYLIETNKEKRKWIYSKSKKIYSFRSNIAHEGLSSMDEDQIETMHYALAYLVNVIVRINDLIIEHHWSKFDELKQYVEDIMFT